MLDADKYEDPEWDFRLGRLDEHEGDEAVNSLIKGKRAKLAPKLRWLTIYQSSRPVTAEGKSTFHFQHYTVAKTPPLKANGQQAGHAHSRNRKSAQEAARYQLYIQRADLAEEERAREVYADRDGFVDFGNFSESAREAADFWNLHELQERRDGRVQSRVTVELPHELAATLDGSNSAYRSALEKFCQAFEEKGLPWHVTVHLPDIETGSDERNFHAHIVYSERPSIRLSEGVWRFEDKKDRDAQGARWVKSLRDRYAAVMNEALDRESDRLAAAGEPPLPRRYDPRRYKEMGIEKSPAAHLGPKRTALERSGYPTREGMINAFVEDFYRQSRKPVADKLMVLTLVEPLLSRHVARSEARPLELDFAPSKRRALRAGLDTRIVDRMGRLMDAVPALERRLERLGRAEVQAAELEGRPALRLRFLERLVAERPDLEGLSRPEIEEVTAEVMHARTYVRNLLRPDLQRRCADRLQGWFEREVKTFRERCEHYAELDRSDRLSGIESAIDALQIPPRIPTIEDFARQLRYTVRSRDQVPAAELPSFDAGIDRQRNELQISEEAEERARALDNSRRDPAIEDDRIREILFILSLKPAAISPRLRRLSSEAREVLLERRKRLLGQDPDSREAGHTLPSRPIRRADQDGRSL